MRASSVDNTGVDLHLPPEDDDAHISRIYNCTQQKSRNKQEARSLPYKPAPSPPPPNWIRMVLR